MADVIKLSPCDGCKWMIIVDPSIICANYHAHVQGCYKGGEYWEPKKAIEGGSSDARSEA